MSYRIPVLAWVFAATCMLSAPGAAASGPCAAEEYRQFDFWLGHWEAKSADGLLLGRNHIHGTLDGCVLQENWASARGGSRGKSFNQFDRTGRVWRQAWVDNGGGHLLLEGSFTEGRMVLAGDTTAADGKPLRNRITWTPLDDGRVRQLWEASRDDGATWTVSFDGYYEKVAPPAE